MVTYHAGCLSRLNIHAPHKCQQCVDACVNVCFDMEAQQYEIIIFCLMNTVSFFLITFCFNQKHHKNITRTGASRV